MPNHLCFSSKIPLINDDSGHLLRGFWMKNKGDSAFTQGEPGRKSLKFRGIGMVVLTLMVAAGLGASPAIAAQVDLIGRGSRLLAAPVADPGSYRTDIDASVPIILRGTGTGPFTYAIVSGPINGSLSTGTEPNITYTPNTAYHGMDSFTFTVEHTGGISAPAEILITVNQIPIIDSQQPLSTLEEVDLTIQLADLTVPDGDNTYPDDFTLTIQPPVGSDYSVVGNTITPAGDFNGDLTVPVTVRDGISDSVPFNLSVTVDPVNDLPLVSDIPSESIAEGGSFATINLNNYVTDVESADAVIVWTHNLVTNLTVSIVNQVATIG